MPPKIIEKKKQISDGLNISWGDFVLEDEPFAVVRRPFFLGTTLLTHHRPSPFAPLSRALKAKCTEQSSA